MHDKQTHVATAICAVAAAALVIAAPRPATAQFGGPVARPVAIGLAVGANVPNGDYGDGVKTGLVAAGYVALRAASSLGIRGELFWSRSDIDSPIIRDVGGSVLPSTGLGETSGNVDLIGAEGNAELSLGSSPLLQPYLVGGVGVYRRRVAQDIAGTVTEFRSLRESDTDFGWNGGAGLRLSLAGLRVFAEARYHSVNTEPVKTTFLPVTVGLEF